MRESSADLRDTPWQAARRWSLELANALIYSSAIHNEVAMPLDREAYAALVDRLRGVP